MIKDNLQHINYYNYLTKELQFGLNYISETNFTNIENGKYELAEGKIFAIIQDYKTKPEKEGKFEAHKKYIDIQFIVEGEENIATGQIDDFDICEQYNEEKDVCFLTPKNNDSYKFINLKEKEFAIFLPSDVHMPCICVNQPINVKKVVLKILINN